MSASRFSRVVAVILCAVLVFPTPAFAAWVTGAVGEPVATEPAGARSLTAAPLFFNQLYRHSSGEFTSANALSYLPTSSALYQPGTLNAYGEVGRYWGYWGSGEASASAAFFVGVQSRGETATGTTFSVPANIHLNAQIIRRVETSAAQTIQLARVDKGTYDVESLAVGTASDGGFLWTNRPMPEGYSHGYGMEAGLLATRNGDGTYRVFEYQAAKTTLGAVGLSFRVYPSVSWAQLSTWNFLVWQGVSMARVDSAGAFSPVAYGSGFMRANMIGGCLPMTAEDAVALEQAVSGTTVEQLRAASIGMDDLLAEGEVPGASVVPTVGPVPDGLSALVPDGLLEPVLTWFAGVIDSVTGAFDGLLWFLTMWGDVE